MFACVVLTDLSLYLICAWTFVIHVPVPACTYTYMNEYLFMYMHVCGTVPVRTQGLLHTRVYMYVHVQSLLWMQ